MFSKKILTLMGAASVAAAAYAIPANPRPITYTQPDGTKVTFQLRGDENYSWGETSDGFTLLAEADGSWRFAQIDNSGMLVASDIVYRGDSRIALDAGINPGLKLNPAQANSKRSLPDKTLQIQGTFPSSGKRKLLMVLINFSDTEPKYSQQDFINMMNQENYGGIGSFRDYYLNQSYGQLDIETTVTPWVNLQYPSSYFGSDGARDMIYIALKQIDPDIDFSEFDNDGDGIVDGLTVIHQGLGQEATGNPYQIWSHSAELAGVSMDGVIFQRYTIEAELLPLDDYSTTMGSIGVVAHEFGHNLGSPDFYDADYDGSGGTFPGTGPWDLMGSGAWNGENYLGTRPAGINMWQKAALNWVTPVSLGATQEISGMEASNDQPVCYRVDTTIPGEYFILENRQKSGPFDSALPGSGLLIYRANENLIRAKVLPNTVNAGHPEGMYLICSYAPSDPDGTTASYGNLNFGSTPFPGTKGVTEFSDHSIPSAKSMSGRKSFFGIHNIAETNGKISFNFEKVDAPESPANLRAEAKQGVVTLYWDIEGDVKPNKFNIYLDDELIGETTEYSYELTDPIRGRSVTYCVDAEYDDDVSPYSMVTMRVPDNKVLAVDQEITPNEEGNNAEVKLRFSPETRLTRAEMDNFSLYTTTSYHSETVEFGHRYRAVDLGIYKGSRITSISFFPLMSPADAQYTARVWETDSNGENPKVITEKTVTEFATSTWKEVTLPKAVTIVAGREYYVTVECSSPTYAITVFCDQADILQGLGNWMKQYGEWKADTGASGNFRIFANVTPAKPNKVTEMPEITDPEDPDTDLIYPLGFKVYRDGKEVGTTGNLLFIDPVVWGGDHTYSVTSIYRGSHETEAIETSLFIEGDPEPVGVDSMEAARFSVIAFPGALDVTADATVTISDIAGRVVYRGRPGRIALPAGLYIVSDGRDTTKAIVK